MPIYYIEHATPQMVWTIERTYIEAADEREANDIYEELDTESWQFRPDQVIVEDQSTGIDDVYETVELTENDITDEIRTFVEQKKNLLKERNTE